MNRISLDKSALKAMDEYLEYRRFVLMLEPVGYCLVPFDFPCRIVADDDGGELLTTEDYVAYKSKIVPQRTKNRLYVSFGVPGGVDCKLIGPETQCFCTHRYKQHKVDFEEVPSDRPLSLPCRVRGCRCSAYHYVPQTGSKHVHCKCKHLPQDHSEDDHICKKCGSCPGFQCTLTCGCGQPSSAHQTLVETKSEREARGKPVGKDVPYAAMGGLTGFSSLIDGYLSLETNDS